MADIIRISDMVNLILHNNRCIQDLYTYWQSRSTWSLLSGTVITRISTTVGGPIFALGWLILGMNWAKNWEGSLHLVVQETINLIVASEIADSSLYLILKAIFGWKRCALNLHKYSILFSLIFFWAAQSWNFLAGYIFLSSYHHTLVDFLMKI